ncbi:MAG: VOC family protein [Betaproteobacteria bacterium]|nr:VOC family protein [Betaproteobacteria bacterium]
MIGYITLGTNDLARAAAFYDALLAEMAAKRVWDTDRGIGWGVSRGQPTLGLLVPFDGQPASPGNGTMVALMAGSREMVDTLHARALALGGTDEGAPGDRGGGFYGAYFRDPDGNKLCFFHFG